MSPIEKIALVTGIVVGCVVGKALYDYRAGIAAFLWLGIICFILPIFLWFCTFSYFMLLLAILYSGIAIPAGFTAIALALILKYVAGIK